MFMHMNVTMHSDPLVMSTFYMYTIYVHYCISLQLHSHPVLSSVVAITVSYISPVKVVRHYISDSRRSSGAVTIVQSTTTRAGQAVDVLNMDNESFHTPTPFSFDNNKFDEDDDNYRFTTNFVTPPLRKGLQLTAEPLEALDPITIVKEKRANQNKIMDQLMLLLCPRHMCYYSRVTIFH